MIIGLAAFPHASVRSDNTGLVFMYSDLEPYVIAKNNSVSGFLADYLNTVAKETQIKAIWQNVPWNRQLPTLRRNLPNVCAVGLVKTPERLTYMRFTETIGKDEAFILMASKNRPKMLAHKSFRAVLNDPDLSVCPKTN